MPRAPGLSPAFSSYISMMTLNRPVSCNQRSRLTNQKHEMISLLLHENRNHYIPILEKSRGSHSSMTILPQKVTNLIREHFCAHRPIFFNSSLLQQVYALIRRAFAKRSSKTRKRDSWTYPQQEPILAALGIVISIILIAQHAESVPFAIAKVVPVETNAMAPV